MGIYERHQYDTHEYTYRGYSFTIRIIADDYAENPLSGMDSPGIWIHDNAKRSWDGLAMLGSIWDAIGGDWPYDKYPGGVEEAYLNRAYRQYEAMRKSELERLGAMQLDTSIPEQLSRYQKLEDQAHTKARRECLGIQSVAEFFERETGGIARVLYGLDHSGQSVSLGDFGDRWDSGAIGIAYMTPKMIRDRMLWKRITKARRDELPGILAGDITALDNWLQGFTFGFVIEDADGEEIDDLGMSVWGHYDDWDASYTKQSAEEACRSYVDGLFENIDVQRVQRYATDVGFALGGMIATGTDDPERVGRMMTRLSRSTSRIREWRRKEVMREFEAAIESAAAIVHPLDTNLTTRYANYA